MLALPAALAAAFMGCGKAEAVYCRDDTSISVKKRRKVFDQAGREPHDGV